MVGASADGRCLRRQGQAQSVNCTQRNKADIFCTQAVEAWADLVGDGHTEAAILGATVRHQERPKVVYQER